MVLCRSRRPIYPLVLMALTWLPWPEGGQVAALEAADAPDTIELVHMRRLYGPVSFDHLMHVDLAPCSRCHHHTTGTGQEDPRCQKCHGKTEEADSVACADCHRLNPWNDDQPSTAPEPYHSDIPGLKGAYHLACLDCHRQLGAPADCQDCHPLTTRGASLLKISPRSAADGPQATTADKERP